MCVEGFVGRIVLTFFTGNISKTADPVIPDNIEMVWHGSEFYLSVLKTLITYTDSHSRMATLFAFLLTFALTFHQTQEPGQISFQILDEETGEPLSGATVYIRELDRGKSADNEGFTAFEETPAGMYTFIFRYVGYEEVSRTYDVPFTGDQPIQIFMEHEHEHLDEITVSTTRTTRSIEDAPTRVEAITLEEIEEKGNMRPGDIRMLLAESTGIQVQQTSAISGSSNFRIQGLDGRYTQLLKDGLPLYSGFSGGLSIMQIPPLDLYQVEVVKGANSTLYGGGAIAGLVNLISKEPRNDRELSFLANASTSNSRDLSGFYSEMFDAFGLTLFGAYNQNSGYDPSDQGFSAIPEYERFTLNPRLFWEIRENTRIMAGGQLTMENRLGGDMMYIGGEDLTDRYFEQHDTRRLSTQFSLHHRFSDQTSLTAKNSITFFERSIEVPGFLFNGNQTASFSEAAIQHISGRGSWVGGVNLWTDRFDEKNGNPSGQKDFSTTLFGGFLQNSTRLTDQISVEAGLRLDYARPAAKNTGWFLLPRISALYRINSEWSMRLGGGMGYKMPDMFTDEAENRAFRNVLPPDLDEVKAEQSYGLNYDINYRTILAEIIVLRVNQLIYYTHLDNPLILEQGSDNLFRFDNLDGFIRSRGAETNIAFIYDYIKLFLGYTYVDAIQDDGVSAVQVPLNSPHQGSVVLMFEEHGSYRLGFESYYYSSQKLNDSTTGRGYTIFGIMGEKTWGSFTVFANFENIFDTRQTRFGPVYSGNREQPQFRDIYAPLEGRYVNLGVKIRM
jgi:outer membrane receptor for ferrienterochelin and colicins